MNRPKIAQLPHIAVATAEWVNWYNTTRPHSAINMHTHFYLVINENKWNSLPPDLQKMMKDASQL